MEQQLYWHFVRIDADGLPRLAHKDGREVRVGETLTVDGAPKLCAWGFHGCKRLLDAVRYCPGDKYALCLVQLGGTVIDGDDKSVATERTTIAMLDVDATDSLLRKIARRCALSVAHLWPATDVALRWLETGDEDLHAAAYDAARTETTARGPAHAADALVYAARAAHAAYVAFYAGKAADYATYAAYLAEVPLDATMSALNENAEAMALEAMGAK